MSWYLVATRAGAGPDGKFRTLLGPRSTREEIDATAPEFRSKLFNDYDQHVGFDIDLYTARIEEPVRPGYFEVTEARG